MSELTVKNINAPKISVIVPVYNVEKYINKCIDSILDQTYADFELLLIDDGSPDNCGAICDEYAAKDSRVRVFHQNNAGVSAARNKGLDEARGEFITFVDSDDYIDENLFYQYINCFNLNPIVDLVCLSNWIDSQIYSHESSVRSSCDFVSFLILNKLAPSLWLTIIKRNCLKGFFFDTNLSFYEDLHFLLSISSVIKNVYIFSEYSGYYYTQRIDSCNSQFLNPKKMTCLNVYNLLKRVYYPDYISESLIGALCVYMALQILINSLSNSFDKNKIYHKELRLFIRENIKYIIRSKNVKCVHKLTFSAYVLTPYFAFSILRYYK